MAYPNAYQQYQETQVFTASRGQLLLMTYDGAIRFVTQARGHMASKSYELQNDCIIKAQRILLELISTLDSKASPDLAWRLTQLYEYLFNRLVEANVSDNVEALDEVRSRLVELRTTWADADRKLSSPPPETSRGLHATASA